MSFQETVDAVDAAIFTGDALEYKVNRDFLADHLQRWRRELARAASAALDRDIVCADCGHVNKGRFTNCLYCGEPLKEAVPCHCHPMTGKQNGYCPRHGNRKGEQANEMHNV